MPGRPPAELADLSPTAAADRIGFLDQLRGFAMFGVLWSNLNDWYGTTGPATSLDRALAWTQGSFIEGRFYTLLGFLFGIGFALQLDRTRGNDGASLRLFYRRMLVLLCFGVFHWVFIWRGDILTTYALLGFALVLYRRVPTNRLLGWALITAYVGPVIARTILVSLRLQAVPPDPHSVQEWLYAHGSYL